VIERAAARWSADPGAFVRPVAQAAPHGSEAADVDLMIRTGGDRRLSDVLRWESAFAELWFTDLMWSEFGGEGLARAIADVRLRERAAILPENRRRWEAPVAVAR
jgi:undecaprenyl diphosphate synthase